jgi:hypothetical protein
MATGRYPRLRGRLIVSFEDSRICGELSSHRRIYGRGGQAGFAPFPGTLGRRRWGRTPSAIAVGGSARLFSASGECVAFCPGSRQDGCIAFVDGVDRSRWLLLPGRLQDYVYEDNRVRTVDASSRRWSREGADGRTAGTNAIAESFFGSLGEQCVKKRVYANHESLL